MKTWNIKTEEGYNIVDVSLPSTLMVDVRYEFAREQSRIYTDKKTTLIVVPVEGQDNLRAIVTAPNGAPFSYYWNGSQLLIPKALSECLIVVEGDIYLELNHA